VQGLCDGRLTGALVCRQNGGRRVRARCRFDDAGVLSSRLGASSNRNNARAALYLAAARLVCQPCMIARPVLSHTRHSQRVRPRFRVVNSNMG
jgi:hypothetical protein